MESYMSWHRTTEVYESEWAVFTKDLGGGVTAVLEEVNKNLGYPNNWRLTARRISQKGKHVIGQWRFYCPPTDDATMMAQKLLVGVVECRD
jgi:hypothetical protein